MTSYQDIYILFEGRLTDSELGKFSSTLKRKAMLENAFVTFESYFRNSKWTDEMVDFDTEIINDELTFKEKNFLGLLMLREFYRQEKVKWSKLVNIVSDSTKLTGIDGTKKSLQENLDEIEEEINQVLATLI